MLVTFSISKMRNPPLEKKHVIRPLSSQPFGSPKGARGNGRHSQIWSVKQSDMEAMDVCVSRKKASFCVPTSLFYQPYHLPSSISTTHHECLPWLPPSSLSCLVQADDHGDQSSEGSNSSLVAVECFVCGRRFEKQKALFGHMKSHPEREWRSVRPDPYREGPWRKRKRRQKLYMEEEEERFAGREMFGTTMIRVTNAKDIASVVTKGGRSRSVCNQTAHQFPTHCGLRHRPKMKMIAKQQRRERRGCLLDLNFPPPLEEEHEELDERKI